MKIRNFLASFLVALFVLPAIAMSESMLALIDMETKFNAVSQRSSRPKVIQHFEIPYRLLEISTMKDLSPEIEKSLVFEKNGEKYVRWIINPEDTRWHLETESWLKANNVSTEKHTHFLGYQTASRSYIVIDPITNAEFSLKVSTNVTGGNWTDKKQTWEDASQIRMLNDYIKDRVERLGGLIHSILLYEPASFGIKNLNQGMVVRSYGELPKSKRFYVPGFSIVHEEMGRRLAKLNGSDNPASFWNENYNKPLARALAEFAAATGVVYDSPHSQNFLVELDAKFKPTGRIVLRDFGDSYLNYNFFKAIGRKDIPNRWETANVVRGAFHVAVGTLHGNQAPSWLNMESKTGMGYHKWGSDFFKEFDKTFKAKTGHKLNWSSKSPQRSGEYFSNDLITSDRLGYNFLMALSQGGGFLSPQKFCRGLFAEAG